ncbi:putative cytosol aminopeptidase [Paenibacillus baekrokdamisoli]|uniref:Probable cytosol aminopeptidase n=1 Tax=Paenibacillus baekrokdamisoli TaxID=1712516 RepID=A0A3G9JLQ0_9BACL|nr:leucyl aminopeptidase family protein [Paenibacillus baekrokdamisoli]MBB3069002.1 leucyl aminopeptidase [Paenibacillus baekrokdamisoli]BBH23824.1 putative cytosol aminopeptidase [Paenibacillus baekrokdamisoli]
MNDFNIMTGPELAPAREMEAIVYLLFDEDRDERDGCRIAPSMKRRGETTWFLGRQQEQHLLVVGMGTIQDLTLERIREAAGLAGRAIIKQHIQTVEIVLGELIQKAIDASDAVTAWVEGLLLGIYAFDSYQSRKVTHSLAHMHIRSEHACEQAVEWAKLRVRGTILSRDLVNEPPDRLNPTAFVKRVQEHFVNRKVIVNVYQGEMLEERQMNGLRTVGRGSRHLPALVEIIYDPDPGQPLLALIGKGVTFDMGGMNVKNGRDISDARMDMGGAAAVIGALDILIDANCQKNIVALLPIADNVPGSDAFLPSEVVTYPNGLTVQVRNTDAEGRLMLADALLHAASLGAAEIIDIATLTGNVGDALGLSMAGMWGDKEMTERLHRIGEVNGDRIWPMPLIDDYEALLRSDYADLANLSSTTYGGAIIAALFLRNFTDRSVPWVHIDMANTVQAKHTYSYYPVGASGYGARLLADYVLAK